MVRVAAQGRSAARHRRHSREARRTNARCSCATSRRWSTASRRRGAWRSSTTGRRSRSTCRSRRARTRSASPTACARPSPRWRPNCRPGVSLQVVRDDSTFIRESIEDVQVTLVLGGLLTVFIVFLFLNSWRSTVITGLTLPISVIAAFIAMRFFGFTLNVLTLMGLSLAIGMLIDDAIVVRENIVRHMQRGKDHLDAARDGTAEIGLAVMATTFTIVAVFIPVAFMARHGRASSSTSSASPSPRPCSCRCSSASRSTRCCRRAGTTRTSRSIAARARSAAILQRFNRRSTICTARTSARSTGRCGTAGSWSAVAVVAFVSAFPILAVLGGDFMPDFNRGEYQVSFKATPGATLRETGDRAQEMVGAAPLAAGRRVHLHDHRRGRIVVPPGHRRIHLRQAEGRQQAAAFSEVLREGARAVEQVPGLTFGFTEAGAFGQKPIQISVRGPEVEVLDRVSQGVRRRRCGRFRVSPTSSRASRNRSRSSGSTSTASARATWAFPPRRSRRRCRPASSGRWRRRLRTAPATTTTCASGCAPTSGGSPRICCCCRCRPTRTTTAATRS